VAALYRKYRPQTFADVVGQEAVVRTLTNAIEQGKVRQAYLFAGPRGTGKTSLARILAKSVNCEHGPTATPDNTCHACVAISNGSSLDVIEMDAASQRGIDDIREIRDRVVLQPVEGRSKVYILDEAHQLTDAAWNALLKLIEEPPPHLLFVFCTTELQKVLPTVRSRCQTFVFQRPRLPELRQYLRSICDGEQIEAPDAALWKDGARRRLAPQPEQLERGEDAERGEILGLEDGVVAIGVTAEGEAHAGGAEDAKVPDGQRVELVAPRAVGAARIEAERAAERGDDDDPARGGELRIGFRDLVR